MPPTPSDVPSLLRELLTEPGRPRLTWYGPDGERIELSSKVLDNWVAKTANLLVTELDVGPGGRVGIDLPAHWRTAVWFLATWAVGACAVHAPPGRPLSAPLDVLVGTRPDAHPQATTAELVAVALPALAASHGPGLPPGALDATAQVRLQADVFLPPVRPAPTDPALESAEGEVDHGRLLATAREAALARGVRPGDRVLTGDGPDRALSAWLGPWALGGSVLLVPAAGPPRREELADLAAQEAVTARL